MRAWRRLLSFSAPKIVWSLTTPVSFLQQHPIHWISPVLPTFQLGRQHFAFRWYCIVQSVDDLIKMLSHKELDAVMVIKPVRSESLALNVEVNNDVTSGDA